MPLVGPSKSTDVQPAQLLFLHSGWSMKASQRWETLPIVSPFFAPDGQLRQAGDEERRFSREHSVATGPWGGLAPTPLKVTCILIITKYLLINWL